MPNLLGATDASRLFIRLISSVLVVRLVSSVNEGLVRASVAHMQSRDDLSENAPYKLFRQVLA